MHDAAWYEYQYNPRIAVPNASEIIRAWHQRSTVFRNQHPPLSDIKYGPHPREVYDLFRAPQAKGTVVFIHGGYWRMLSKLEFAFIAEAFVTEGYSVAMINYPLCPDVDLAQIRNSVLNAFKYLHRETLTDQERQAILITGNSAGGHLAALHALVDWVGQGIAAHAIKGVISLSGVFDVAPLLHTSMNAAIRLTPKSAPPLNLITSQPKLHLPMLLAVGAQEPDEFHRQSHDLATSWSVTGPGYQSIADANHFTIVDAFANTSHVLHRQALAMLAVA
jgi:arylformamidase